MLPTDAGDAAVGGWSRSAAEVDQVERGVVVGRVVVLLRLLAGDDPAGAAGGGTGRDDRVLVVVAGRLAGQDALAVGEDGAVLLVRERTALVDQVEGVVRLGGQGAVADAAHGRGGRGGRRLESVSSRSRSGRTWRSGRTCSSPPASPRR